ncbi:hypothetical protein ACHAXH_007799, partial [Discostella pseudostelligera]
MRYDIGFFLCCCRSFLSSRGRDVENNANNESFYDLLGVTPNATPDELKRAYKRQSLLIHPDKLAQRGKIVTISDRDRFTRMRFAYEVLSDPRRRETYDAVGEKGMKWIEEPLSIDPQELAHNFATSSICDRSKIFAIFLVIYIAIFLLPVLICLMADGTLGNNAHWMAILCPLWIWDVFILFYHSRVILMGPIKRPDHIPEEEWVDPLPMSKRIMAMVRFGCLVLFQVLLALRLDGYMENIPWYIVFIPMYLWEGIALRRKLALANVIIVTPDELELALGKKLVECTLAEQEYIHRRYIVIPEKNGNLYESACRLRSEAKMDVIRILARITFTILLVINLDLGEEWSWWLVFIPIFAMALCIIGSAFHVFARTQSAAVRMDPSLFGLHHPPSGAEDGYEKMEENKQSASPLTDEEKEELKGKVAQSAYRAVGAFFSQCFFLVIICILIGKIEGANYSYLVVISPFLAAGAVILCCLACTIFCISEVDENAGMAEFESAVNQAAAATGYRASAATAADSGAKNSYTPPCPTKQPPPNNGSAAAATVESNGAMEGSATFPTKKRHPSSTWDPERGEVWDNLDVPEVEESEKRKDDINSKDEAIAQQQRDDVHPEIVQNLSITSVTSS